MFRKLRMPDVDTRCAKFALLDRGLGAEVGRCSLRAEGTGLLDQVDLGAGDGGGGDESAVLGADESEVALGDIGAVLGRFQLALEPSDPGHALLGETLLQAKTRRVNKQTKYIHL